MLKTAGALRPCVICGQNNPPLRRKSLICRLAVMAMRLTARGRRRFGRGRFGLLRRDDRTEFRQDVLVRCEPERRPLPYPGHNVGQLFQGRILFAGGGQLDPLGIFLRVIRGGQCGGTGVELRQVRFLQTEKRQIAQPLSGDILD